MRGERGCGGRGQTCHEAPVDARKHRRLPGKRVMVMGTDVALVLPCNVCVFCTLHSFDRDPARSVSVPILHPRNNQALWSQTIEARCINWLFSEEI